ncbi:MAG: GNAT family N-acetyltransferase [Alistipes sp.]|nr:GNAT family N-acetyltransferase [Alistipes sp.]
MKVREIFSEADVRRMVKVAEIVWREANVVFCTPEQVEYMIERFQSFEAVQGQLLQGYRYFVVEEDGDIISYFGVQSQGERLFLSKFYILKEHRGRGIFSMGLDMMKGLCREGGMSAIYLTVNRNNKHAYEVYLKKNFNVVDEQVADIGCGFVMDDYIMQCEVE